MRTLLAALAIAATSPAMAQGSERAGTYIISQMEMGGGLVLRPDKTFVYQLDYGAVSESAAGDWSEADGVVRLTSNPVPKAPRFVMVKDECAPKGELTVTLDSGTMEWFQPLELWVGLPDLRQVEAEEDGRVDTGGIQPVSVVPVLPIYELKPEPYPLDPATGHRVTFRFEPNDLGRIDFRNEPLAIDGESLVMQRYGATIRLRRDAD